MASTNGATRSSPSALEVMAGADPLPYTSGHQRHGHAQVDHRVEGVAGACHAVAQQRAVHAGAREVVHVGEQRVQRDRPPSCSCSFVSHAAGPPHIEKFDMAAVGAFSTTTTFLPASDSLRAAMRPAAPAPTTTASHSFVLLPSLRGMPSCALGSSAVAAPPSLAAAAPFCFGAQPASRHRQPTRPWRSGRETRGGPSMCP